MLPTLLRGSAALKVFFDFLCIRRRGRAALLVLLSFAAVAVCARAATRADILRGAYGPYRANNHLLFYHLDVRVDPEKRFLQGKNTIRFRMLQDGRRIQLDLHRALHVDKILFASVRLKYKRDSGAVFVDFPQTLQAGRVVDRAGAPPRDR